MYAQYERLNLPLWASNRTVVKAAHTMLATKGKSFAQRAQRHYWLRQILQHHKDAQQLYADYRL